MKTLLCCIGRLENQYIREYIEHYKNLGVTNICLYDNNYDGEEHFEDVIGDYIKDGFVILKDYRNKQSCQMQAYEECYKEYGNLYDWILFFDCDEFLVFADSETKNLGQALSDPRFSSFDMIHVNWMVYTDNNMIYNDHRPVLERFTEPVQPFNYKILKSNLLLNDFSKSIIRGGLKDVKFEHPHSPSNITSCCNPIGEPVNHPELRYNPYNFDKMYLKHFRSKTIEEFITKAKRGYPDHKKAINVQFLRHMFNTVFFVDNKVTIEKLNYIKDTIGISLYKQYEKQL